MSYRASHDGVVIVVMFNGMSSGVCSELGRVLIELRVSDMDIKTLSMTELGSEHSVIWKYLLAPRGTSFNSHVSSLKSPNFIKKDSIFSAKALH